MDSLKQARNESQGWCHVYVNATSVNSYGMKVDLQLILFLFKDPEDQKEGRPVGERRPG